MIALDIGDKIRGDASAATVVDYILSGTDANAIKQLADGQLPSGIGDLYTADSVDAVTSIILVNTDSVARTVNLYLTPNGGSDRRLIPKNMTLGIGHSLYTDGRNITVLDASGQVLSTWAVDDTPVDGETDKPISSNWAFDHVADVDQHTEYLLADGSRALAGAWNMGSQLITNLKLGGTLDAGGQVIDNVSYMIIETTSGIIRDVNNSIMRIRGSAAAAGKGANIVLTGGSYGEPGVFKVITPNAAETADVTRLTVSGNADEANITFANSVLIGIKLGGALNVAGQYLTFLERAAPGAGAANEARMYAIVDGGSLTDMAAVFQDGSVDLFAQETTPLDAPIFTYPSKTEAKLELRKEHPGVIKMVAVFPNGEEFVLKHHEYHHPDKIAANKGAEKKLPKGWLIEDTQQIATRLEAEEVKRLDKLKEMEEAGGN